MVGHINDKYQGERSNKFPCQHEALSSLMGIFFKAHSDWLLSFLKPKLTRPRLTHELCIELVPMAGISPCYDHDDVEWCHGVAFGGFVLYLITPCLQFIFNSWLHLTLANKCMRISQGWAWNPSLENLYWFSLSFESDLRVPTVFQIIMLSIDII